MATVAESESESSSSSSSSSPSAEEKPYVPPPPTSSSPTARELASTIKAKALEEATPWIDDVVQRAFIYQKTIRDALHASIEASKSRFSEISSTSSAQFYQTIDSLQDSKSELKNYEDMAFGKLKEGINIAASHPLATGGIAAGLGLVVFKRPRRILYYNALRHFSSEESLISQADAKVKELRQSISRLNAEGEKLEKRLSKAEEELTRGRTKLRQAGKQIRDVIHSAYRIERQSAGLKDILKELPGRDASEFRSQVSSLASVAKQERNALTKEVTKISNYGISV